MNKIWINYFKDGGYTCGYDRNEINRFPNEKKGQNIIAYYEICFNDEIAPTENIINGIVEEAFNNGSIYDDQVYEKNVKMVVWNF